MAYNMYYGHHHQQITHFLEACFLCHKPLGFDRDIFMYRGITAFCSDECRQEQIEIDEAKETSWNLSASMRALRKATSPVPAPKSSATAAKSAVAGTVSVA